jgi:hypothetical protein
MKASKKTRKAQKTSPAKAPRSSTVHAPGDTVIGALETAVPQLASVVDAQAEV